MSRPTSRDELLERSQTEFERLMEGVYGIEPKRRLEASDYPRGSIKDMLAHLDAWHRMVLEWERVGHTGDVAEMPAPGYTWRQAPELNMVIDRRHKNDAWDAVVGGLRQSHDEVRAVIATYTDEELFAKRRYRWTGSTSVGSYFVSATTSHYD